ncbi:LysM peptidoglycan-binding domain-containing protein [uncultured Olegusella sp.]|uniref:LysM peptidoglycan-binding domain-containing protein n=1 Tax=uncultured Olegusella sp. TaxID=1979846 RepID=UPI002606F059|nr:LysM peptidoglycan-binding domain-containing protein [uncultured Olegusella sp.]
MNYRSNPNYSYETAGSSALIPQYRHTTLTLIRGGKDATANFQAQSDDLCQNAALKRSYRFTIFAAIVVVGVMFAASLCISDQLVADRIAAAQLNLRYATTTVQPGDSLWSIAESHQIKGMSTSETLRLIEQLNNIDAQSLSVGMNLSVPA